MNVSLLMVDTVCSGVVRSAPTTSKPGMDADHKPFSLVQKDVSPEVSPNEGATPNGIEKGDEKAATEKASCKSDRTTCKKSKFDEPSAKLDDDVTKEVGSVSNTDEQPEPETPRPSEKCGPDEKNNQVTNEQITQSETLPSNPALQSGDSLSVSAEASEPVTTGTIAAEVSQGILEGIPTDPPENAVVTPDNDMEQDVNISLPTAEAGADKRAPTGETISEQRDLNEESTHPEDGLSDTDSMPRSASLRSEDGTSITQQSHSSEDHDPQTKSDQTFVQSGSANRFVVYESRVSDSGTDASAQVIGQKSQGENASGETSADIGKQVFESIQGSLTGRSSNQQITVHLNPPELGRVLIRFQRQDNDLTGHLEVNKPETRTDIEHALPQMIRDLANCGIHIKRLDVTLSQHDRPQYGTPGDSSPQHGWSQQQGSTDSQTWGNDAYTDGISEWVSNSNTYEQISELQEIPAGDGSVNVLV
jgi:flagellar hook-length control protein FliK